MTSSIVSVDIEGGRFNGYLARPESAAPDAPLVLLLPEIYNLNGWIRQVADRYAQAGLIALVPDLYWRQQANVALEYNPEDQQRGRALGAALERGQAVADLRGAAGWLRQYSRGSVSIVGFCLGGELALLAADAAADAPGLDRAQATIAYYPTNMERHLEALARIDIPALVHIGEKDHRTPPALVADLRQGLAGNAQAEVIVYAGADHGFGRFGYPPHDASSATAAHTRTLALIHGANGKYAPK